MGAGALSGARLEIHVLTPPGWGVAAVLTMKSEEPEAHPTRMGVAETFQTLSA